MLKRFLLAGIFLTALMPMVAEAIKEPELVRLYYINKTPWTIKILIDGGYAIETTWGNELLSGISLQRFARPGPHIFEAYAIEHKYYADWITKKAVFYRYFTEADLQNSAGIEFDAELFAPISGANFIRTNALVLLNIAAFVALLLVCAIIFIWGAYALLIKKSPS